MVVENSFIILITCDNLILYKTKQKTIVMLFRFCSLRTMAWRSHGANNSDMVRSLGKNGIIQSDRVEEVMLQVDRGKYTTHNAYKDSPQSIGYGVTISAPHMHAHALELLRDNLKPGKI